MLYLSCLEILCANLSCLTMYGQIESNAFIYNQVYFYNPHINKKFNIKLVNLGANVTVGQTGHIFFKI